MPHNSSSATRKSYVICLCREKLMTVHTPPQIVVSFFIIFLSANGFCSPKVYILGALTGWKSSLLLLLTRFWPANFLLTFFEGSAKKPISTGQCQPRWQALSKSFSYKYFKLHIVCSWFLFFLRL